MSIRTSGPVATATRPIINPNNLKVEGWYCQLLGGGAQKILQVQEVRDIIQKGIVVDDLDSLAEASELVRLQGVLQINFELLGKTVVGVSKQRLGKVSDYAVDMSTLYVQKIYVSQNLLKSFAGGELVVDRTQIVEITSKQIVVQDPLQGVKTKASSPATAPAT